MVGKIQIKRATHARDFSCDVLKEGQEVKVLGLYRLRSRLIIELKASR